MTDAGQRRRIRKRPPWALRAVHRLVLARARRGAANELRNFDKLVSTLPIFPIDSRASLRSIMRRLRTARQYTSYLSLTVGFIILFACMYASREIGHWTPDRFRGLVHYFPLGWMAIWFMLGAVTIFDWTRENKIVSLFTKSVAVGCPMALAIAMKVLLSHKSTPAEIIGGLSLGGAFFLFLYLAGSALVSYPVTLIRTWSGAGVDAVATYFCFTLLVTLQAEGHRWNQLAWRRTIALRIEQIAQNIERCGIWMRNVGDENSAAWIQRRMAEIAAGVRDKKKWLAIPRVDTRQQLTLAMGETFIALANCDWDSLPHCESSSLDARERLEIGLLRFRGVLVSIAIPAALFWAVQYSPFALKPPVRDYATGFLLLWVLVVLLSTVDPLYQSRIEALRNVVQIFPFGKKDN